MQGLSVSRVKLYEECPRKYRYQYIDKLPQKEKSFFVLGTFVHQTLERCVQNVLKGTSIKNAMRSAFKATYQETPIPDVMLQEVRPWLRMFVEKWSTEEIEPLEVEAQFSFVLNGKFKIRGVVDRVDRSEEGIHIIDYKTSRSADRLDDFQLAVYAAALRNSKYPKEPIIAWYSMVRFDFKPQNRLVISDEHIEQALDRLNETGLRILEEKEWPVNRSSFCQYCDFFQTCFTESPMGSWI